MGGDVQRAAARSVAARKAPASIPRSSSVISSSNCATPRASRRSIIPRRSAAWPRIRRSPRAFPSARRFHSAPVIRLADALRVHLGHCAEADGRWRLFAFADADERPPCARSANSSATSERSPIRRATPPGGDFDAVIDLRAVFQQGHRELALEAMPAALTPRKGRYGLIDYEKMFCPDPGDDIFAARGVDRRRRARHRAPRPICRAACCRSTLTTRSPRSSTASCRRRASLPDILCEGKYLFGCC